MIVTITDMPLYILITVCIQLRPQGLLSFIQVSAQNHNDSAAILIERSSITCRSIHEIGSTDYVWHHINIDLPLDIDRRLADLSASNIKSAVIYVMKLEENWDRPISKISRVSRILPRQRGLDKMRPLGRNWLITSNVDQDGQTRLSVWHLSTASIESTVVGSPLLSF